MSDSDPDPDPKDELGARFDERTPDDDEGDDTDPGTTSASSERVTRDAGSSSETEDETDSEEWVRVQFRVPESIRTDLNEIGYAKLMMALRERGIEGMEKRELQHAAVQMLLDNPDVWADTVEELDEP